MRKVKYVQILLLILCLGITGLFVYVRPADTVVGNSGDLETILSEANDSYRIVKNSLSLNIVNALELDDYVFQTYFKNGVSITLYVGFYYSGKRVGAAHDPQVCYPGQGWQLSNKESGRFDMGSLGEINYSSVFAESENDKDLVVYWFQVEELTASNTLMQKIHLLKKKIMQEGEQNAFVRVSTSYKDVEPEIARSTILEFINDFYPHFMSYINSHSIAVI